MGQIAGSNNTRFSGFNDPLNTCGLISNSEDLHSACLLVKEYFSHNGVDLLGVTFCDLVGEHPAMRPFRQYPDTVIQLSLQLRERGGCPVVGEAKRLCHPFDALQIESARYPEFLSQRFLKELRKLGHYHIPVTPVMLGRGLAIFSTGFREKAFDNEAKVLLVNTICQVTAAIIGRFPEVTKLFEPESLSTIEAEMLLFSSNGSSTSEIASQLGWSEIAVNMILDSAVRKLGARSRAHAVTRALVLGEISNMQIGEHELI